MGVGACMRAAGAAAEISTKSLPKAQNGTKAVPRGFRGTIGRTMPLSERCPDQPNRAAQLAGTSGYERV
ncbi:MAG: hypothetical protein ACK56F_19960, partial [bacterium]